MKLCCIAISATDPSSGAGAQLDVRLLDSHGIYPVSVISGVTVQDIDTFKDFSPVSLPIFISQLEIALNKFPATIIKVGMLGDNCAEALKEMLDANSIQHKLVLDPILSSSSGFSVASAKALSSLFSKCFLITPNIPEMEFFINRKILCKEDMLSAVREFYETFRPASVLLKSGHLPNSDYTDVFYDGVRITEFETSGSLVNFDVHGTGCYLSTSISAYMTKGFDVLTSISKAKSDIVIAMNKACKIGQSCRKVFTEF